MVFTTVFRNRANGDGGYDLKGLYHKNNDAKKDRIKYAVHNYQQVPTRIEYEGAFCHVINRGRISVK